MPQLIRPGVRLNYELWGESGPWITLVNGYTRPLNDFRLMGRHLQAAGFRILALDNRGAGETAADGAFTLFDMADDVKTLWDKCDIDATSLLGISMGGFIAQQLVISYPQWVERLALVSTAPRHASVAQDTSPWSSDPREVQRKLNAYFTDEFRQRNEGLVISMAKQIARNVASGDFARRADMQRDAVLGFDQSEKLAAIRCPTLVVHGDHDLVVPLAAGRELAELIPGAELAVLPDRGHLLLAEAPREFYDLVTAFFRERRDH